MPCGGSTERDPACRAYSEGCSQLGLTLKERLPPKRQQPRKGPTLQPSDLRRCLGLRLSGVAQP